jgi:hypothetical protein
LTFLGSLSYENDEIHKFGLKMEHKLKLSSTVIDSKGVHNLEYKNNERFDIHNHMYFDRQKHLVDNYAFIGETKRRKLGL